MAKLTKTSKPGIFRAHRKGCVGEGRCDCPYTVVTRHRGRQVKTTVATFGEARELKGRKDSGQGRPSARVRVETYFDQWIETYAGRTSAGFQEVSRDEYRRVIEKRVLPAWGTWKLSDVESSDARCLFFDLREASISTGELRKVRAALSAMFGTAADDDGLLRSNPIAGVRLPGPVGDDADFEDADERSKALSREELGLLLAAFPDSHRMFFEFLAHTGLRIGEAAGLRWEHLTDLAGQRPYLRVREQVYRGRRKKLKSKKGKRDLPLSPGMATKLRAHRRDSYEGERAPVFPSSGTLRRTDDGLSYPFSPNNLGRDVLIPTREALGMDWVTFHTFRHTCASLLFSEGRNIKQVQKWLGHADPSFTLKTYVHLMDEGIGDAAFFDDAVAVAGPERQGNARATRGAKRPEDQPSASGQDLAG